MIVPEKVLIYHITDVVNLAGILAEGGLLSDVAMAQKNPTVIGYSHIKARRMKEIRVACCRGRFVGEFVPFYLCPRSPMLFTINKGNTGRPAGCQKSILHLVSVVEFALTLGGPWAVSDGNAGAFHTCFYSDLVANRLLDWAAIRATNWQGKQHQKAAEFLVADFFPWNGIQKIGCYNSPMAARVKELLQNQSHCPLVETQPLWYY
jgi:hypothetical protein